MRLCRTSITKITWRPSSHPRALGLLKNLIQRLAYKDTIVQKWIMGTLKKLWKDHVLLIQQLTRLLELNTSIRSLLNQYWSRSILIRSTVLMTPLTNLWWPIGHLHILQKEALGELMDELGLIINRLSIDRRVQDSMFRWPSMIRCSVNMAWVQMDHSLIFIKLLIVIKYKKIWWASMGQQPILNGSQKSIASTSLICRNNT